MEEAGLPMLTFRSVLSSSDGRRDGRMPRDAIDQSSLET
jgi:hypothetical protein